MQGEVLRAMRVSKGTKRDLEAGYLPVQIGFQKLLSSLVVSVRDYLAEGSKRTRRKTSKVS